MTKYLSIRIQCSTPRPHTKLWHAGTHKPSHEQCNLAMALRHKMLNQMQMSSFHSRKRKLHPPAANASCMHAFSNQHHTTNEFQLAAPRLETLHGPSTLEAFGYDHASGAPTSQGWTHPEAPKAQAPQEMALTPLARRDCQNKPQRTMACSGANCQALLQCWCFAGCSAKALAPCPISADAPARKGGEPASTMPSDAVLSDA